jgi:hypothetical protein
MLRARYLLRISPVQLFIVVEQPVLLVAMSNLITVAVRLAVEYDPSVVYDDARVVPERFPAARGPGGHSDADRPEWPEGAITYILGPPQSKSLMSLFFLPEKKVLPLGGHISRPRSIVRP